MNKKFKGVRVAGTLGLAALATTAVEFPLWFVDDKRLDPAS